MAKKKETNFKKYIKRFWIIVLGGFASILLVFLLASWGIFGELPTFEELENPEKNLATEVISSDGVTWVNMHLKIELLLDLVIYQRT